MIEISTIFLEIFSHGKIIQTCAAMILLGAFMLVAITLTLEIGTVLIHRFVDVNNQYKQQIFEIIKHTSMLNQMILLLFLAIFVTLFSEACAALCYLFYPLTTLLAFIFTIRLLITSSSNMQLPINCGKHINQYLAKYTKHIQKTLQWLLTDTSLIILIIFCAMLGSILNGMPFYFNNHECIISLFSIDSCFNLATLNILILALAAAITQSSIACYIKTGWEKMKFNALVSSMILLSAISFSIITLEQLPSLPSSFLFTYFPKQIVTQLFMILPILTICCTFLLLINTNTIKITRALAWVALVFSTWIIAILILVFAMIIFPNIIPSSLDLSQNLTIFKSFSDINTLQILLPILSITLIITKLYTIFCYVKTLKKKI